MTARALLAVGLVLAVALAGFSAVSEEPDESQRSPQFDSNQLDNEQREFLTDSCTGWYVEIEDGGELDYGVTCG